MRRQHLLSGHRHQPVLGHAVHRVDGRAILGGMTNPCRQQRMILAEERTDDQQRVEGIDLVDGVAQPGHTGAGGVDGEVGLTQPEVDVLAAQATHQRTAQIQLLQRGGRRKQHADGLGPVLLSDVGQRVRHVVQCGLPRRLAPLVILLDHRHLQAVSRLQPLIREAVAVRDPAFVDRLVLAGQHTLDAIVLDLHDDVGAQRIVRGHRTAAGQFPGTGRVTERLAGERPHRADVDHVARQLGVDRMAQEAEDLRVLAPPGHAQLHDAPDLLTEAHAAGAMDAARHLLGGDERTHALVEDDPLFLTVIRHGMTVAHRQVLQLTFAALVADRTVQRMVDQQELHHRLLGLDGLAGMGVDLHAGGDRRGTGGQCLGRLLHLHQAHAAAGGNG